MKKHIYESPEIEITKFDIEDVITTSSDNTGAFDGEWVPLP